MLLGRHHKIPSIITKIIMSVLSVAKTNRVALLEETRGTIISITTQIITTITRPREGVQEEITRCNNIQMVIIRSLSEGKEAPPSPSSSSNSSTTIPLPPNIMTTSTLEAIKAVATRVTLSSMVVKNA